ncbi:MAG: DUF4147 domain-containing protein, partial [Acidobacteriota bacterium]|nr:DUF4147 domain-containing protein [Acidobacteriota bacterium]
MNQIVEEALCRDAEQILREAVSAVEPAALVRRALQEDGTGVLPGGDGRLHVVAVGKGAASMYEGFVSAIDRHVDAAIVCTLSGLPTQPLGNLSHHVTSHPLPGPESVAAGEEIYRLAQASGPSDRFVLLLSGGASSMMEMPRDGVGHDEVRETIHALHHSGATIHELNCVRKQLCRLKGGGLAAALGGATALGLILSDVIDDAEDVIGSGPLASDRTHPRQALDILRLYRLEGRTPTRILRFLRERKAEKPTGLAPSVVARVRTRVIGNGWTAARAAATEAIRLGYETEILSPNLAGEAREAGRFIAATARLVATSVGPPDGARCMVCCGESQVTLRGDGHGGSNQELALAAAIGIDGLEETLVASMDTDGVDGPTEAAGAFATGSTVSRARERGIDCGASLDKNDSHAVFASLDDLIVSGAT